MQTPTHFARRAGYSYAGTPVQEGQLLDLRGLPNDEKLVRLGYLAEVPDGTDPVTCGECGLLFVDDRRREMHGNRVHAFRPADFDPEEEDNFEESEFRRMEQVAPLYLDKTLATLKG